MGPKNPRRVNYDVECLQAVIPEVLGSVAGYVVLKIANPDGSGALPFAIPLANAVEVADAIYTIKRIRDAQTARN